ncbi:heme exporter protein CcmD [Aquitalea aquatica]|uniref:Heme exporter protein D n=1 Tax=Aquitalea aquatica TaxID=3044273 RepID=A0A838Y3X4_9NEIS|nr:heme exporter protein CcmD [Aquitalea magnusonii]MBA4710140.1 heme exporter protein CcmD [Aquitalea magnusonii]
MKWDSLSAFMAMGGYGFYVWSAVALALLMVLGELCWLRHSQHSLHHRLRQQPNTAPDRGWHTGQ